MQQALFKESAAELRTLEPGKHLFSMLAKKGELEALELAFESKDETHMPLVNYLRPGLDMHGEDIAITRDRLRGFARRTKDAVGSRLIFVDSIGAELDVPIQRYRKTKNPGKFIDEFYDACGYANLHFIPVVDIAKPAAYVDAVKAALENHCRGAAFRLKIVGTVFPPGKGPATILREALDKFGVEPAEVDLILYLDYIAPDTTLSAKAVSKDIGEAESVGKWRSVSILGSSIPQTLAGFTKGQVEPIERKELKLWKELVALGHTNLVFGDCGIQNPVPPTTSGGQGYAAVRYSIDEATLASRGCVELQHADERVEEWRGCCVRLVGNPNFVGGDDSAADEYIELAAEDGPCTDNRTVWRRLGTVRHLRVVRDQITPGQQEEDEIAA
jgi:hypothetical protein